MVTRKSFHKWLIVLSFTAVTYGCLPVPVSTVPLHPREERHVALETAQAEHSGAFSSPVFDSTGALLAAYDSGNNLVRIFRSSDLTQVYSLKPTRRPRRLSFSPRGRFLVIESYQGWIENYLGSTSGKSPRPSSPVKMSSPEAVRDDIQRVELWDLRSGMTIRDLSCDAVATVEPRGGWLWAREWAIAPGYRSSALLDAHFSGDETEFSVLCWNGVRQRWNGLMNWKRLEDVSPPPFWDALMALSTASWLAQENPVCSSENGRIIVFRVRKKHFGFSRIYIWDRNTAEIRELPGACDGRLLPAHALSRDGNRVVIPCNKGLGYAIRVWEFDSGRELPLKDAEFGIQGGLPSLSSGGVALSCNGRYLAAALLGQMEALLPNVFLIPAGKSRSDLRLWSVDEGKELVAVPIDDLVGREDSFGGVDLAFSPDDSMLVVSGRRLRIYRLIDLDPDAR